MIIQNSNEVEEEAEEIPGFKVHKYEAPPEPDTSVQVGKLDVSDFEGAKGADDARALPHAARLAWPIVTDLDGVVALPHLVLGERRAPDPHEIGVVIHLLATRERRIDGPMANGRLTT